jgi:hypothetical protein
MPGEQLSRKQEQAIAALLSESTIAEAATRVNVSERTLRGWLKQPTFKLAFSKARTAVLNEAVTALLQAANKAVTTLVAELTAEKSADRIKAATAILDRAVDGVTLIDFETRLAAVEEERAVEQQPSGRGRR